MAVPIGISVGDFIATIKLLQDIANALDEHSGAQSHYRHTLRDLETIQALLSRLESFHSTSGQTTQINAIRAQAQAINSEVQAFIQKAQKFRSTLGSGAPTNRRHGIIDKIKWSRKHTKEAARLSRSIDVQLRNIQVLLDLDLSERSDLTLRRHQDVATDLSSLPTRQELLSSTSQAVKEMHAAGQSTESRLDRAEAALLFRLDLLEESTRKTSESVAKTHDLQDLRAYIDERLSSVRSGNDLAAPPRLALTLTIPRLQLSKQDMTILLARFADELQVIAQCLSVYIGSILAFLVLAVPQLVLLQRTLRRLPAAVSLVLHDNMTFEDALGRFHSLQYQQFRHWKVFETSLQCIFADTPGLQKILQGHFLLTPEDQPAVALTAANYSTLVRPGYAFKMSMAMKKLTTRRSLCPKGCDGQVERVSVLEYRCKDCQLQYFTSVWDPITLEDSKPGRSGMAEQLHTSRGDANKVGIDTNAGSPKGTSKAGTSKPNEMPRLDPQNSSLVLWKPQRYDAHDLVDGWERARELAELKFFKRVHLKVSEPQSQGYFEKFFRVERELGTGDRGVALLVDHVLDGVTLGRFVCKRVHLGNGHSWAEKIPVEAEQLTQLSHQNVASYRHVWCEDFRLMHFGPRVPYLFFLQQYCNGDNLLKFMYPPAHTSTSQLRKQHRRRSRPDPNTVEARFQNPRRLQFQVIRSLFKDIAAGVQYLHQHGDIHGNLTPRNCLLHTVGNKTRALISDFGQVPCGPQEHYPLWVDDTISFCAPEVLRHSNRYGPYSNMTVKSDVFSLGMILYFLCSGKLPYTSANVLDEDFADLDQLTAEIVSWSGLDDEGKLRVDLPSRLDLLLRRMLSIDPDTRPTIEEVHRSIDLIQPRVMLA